MHSIYSEIVFHLMIFGVMLLLAVVASAATDRMFRDWE